MRKTLLFSFLLLAACAYRKSGEAPAPLGLAPAEVEAAKKARGGEAAMACWWCGTYNCTTPGTHYTCNNPPSMTIAFMTPPAVGCSSPTTLADGSRWTLAGTCACSC